MLVCDFPECPFELMSYCDESVAMRCPDCPFARCVPDDPAAKSLHIGGVLRPPPYVTNDQ